MTVASKADNETLSLYRDAQDIEELAWWDIYSAAPDRYARDHKFTLSACREGPVLLMKIYHHLSLIVC